MPPVGTSAVLGGNPHMLYAGMLAERARSSHPDPGPWGGGRDCLSSSLPGLGFCAFVTWALPCWCSAAKRLPGVASDDEPLGIGSESPSGEFNGE